MGILFYLDSMYRRTSIFFALLLATSCGSGENSSFDASVSTQSPPVVTRISPTSGKVGDTVTLFGFGFSSEPANNIVSVGGGSTTATSYGLVNPPAKGEIESLTFKIPSGVANGSNSIFATVFENASNADVAFTVNP